MSRLVSLFATAASLAVWAAPAHAQEAPAAGSITLDRGDRHSRFGLEVAYLAYDDIDLGLATVELTSLRFDLHGQYVSPSGLGGYATLPLSILQVDTGVEELDQEDTGVGNLELGALFVLPLEGQPAEMVFRGGLALPTANEPDEPLAVAANAAASPARLTDLPLMIPDSTWLRLGASPVLRIGQFFARADAGLDIPIDDGDVDLDPLLRLNVGGGVDLGPAALLVELASVGTTGDDAPVESFDGDDDDFYHTLALGARFRAGNAQPYLALLLPLDDNIEDALDLVITFGIEAVLPTGP